MQWKTPSDYVYLGRCNFQTANNKMMLLLLTFFKTFHFHNNSLFYFSNNQVHIGDLKHHFMPTYLHILQNMLHFLGFGCQGLGPGLSCSHPRLCHWTQPHLLPCHGLLVRQWDGPLLPDPAMTHRGEPLALLVHGPKELPAPAVLWHITACIPEKYFQIADLPIELHVLQYQDSPRY